MSKARNLADIVAAGQPLADGTIETTDITDVTASATELNYTDGVTSNIQTQLDAKMTPTYTGDVDITGNITVSGTVDGRDIATNIPSTLGTAGQVLTVNSGATAGEWADGGGGGWELISTTTISGNPSSVSISLADYPVLRFEYVEIEHSANSGLYLNVKANDGTNNVTFRGARFIETWASRSNSTLNNASLLFVTQSSETSNGTVLLYNAYNTGKTGIYAFGGNVDTTNNYYGTERFTGGSNGTYADDAVPSVTFNLNQAATMSSGTIYLYGSTT
jgi:hypothetical protein